MEYYTYVNIFETKGLEYLLLLAFLALFIFLLKYLAGPEKKASGAQEKGSTRSGWERAAGQPASRKRR